MGAGGGAPHFDGVTHQRSEPVEHASELVIGNVMKEAKIALTTNRASWMMRRHGSYSGSTSGSFVVRELASPHVSRDLLHRATVSRRLPIGYTC